ncbi:MAG: SpoIIE family protein phosphatase [Desulfarculaceae bacterium]|nr:SpoIIE family protein phosphatase [Desulfarculaceae bacterium]
MADIASKAMPPNQPDAQSRLWATLVRFVLLFIPVAAFLTITVYIFYQIEANNERRLLMSEQHNQVQLERETLATILEDVVTDTLVQAQHHLLRDWPTPPTLTALRRLSEEFMGFAETTRMYGRISFIDTKGTELVRVDYRGGRAHLTPESLAVDLADRPWVQRALALQPGQVYISPLVLNSSSALEPIIRVAAPVFSQLGVRLGLVVMDYKAARALKKLAGLRPERGMSMLLGQEGRRLMIADATNRESQNKERGFAETWPQAWQRLSSEEQGQFFEKAGLFTWATVRPPVEGSGHPWWKIVSLVPEAQVDAAVGIYLMQLTQLLTVVLFVAGIICWFLAWAQVRHRQAQRALAQSEQRLRDILTYSPAVIFLKDLEGRYLLINRRYEELFHIPQADVVGMTDADLFPAPIAQKFRENDKEVLAKGRPLHREEQAPQDDGLHTYLSAKFPLRDLRGVNYGVCGISTDITSLKQAQAQLSQAKEEAEAVNRELLEKQGRLDEDLKAAAGIQRTLLPYNLPRFPHLELAWKFAPSEVIGGDLFHAQPLGPDHLCLYMLDVAGHGVPAALVTVSVHETLDPASGHVMRMDQDGRVRVTPPGEVLAILDREYPLERFEKSFSIVYMLLEMNSGRLTYSSAGHPPPILMRAGGGQEQLEAGGTLIGLDGAVPFEEESLQLAPGDKLIFYTDGVVEYGEPGKELFGMERFLRYLERRAARPVSALLEGMWQELLAFGRGRPPADDVSLMGLEYKGRRDS